MFSRPSRKEAYLRRVILGCLLGAMLLSLTGSPPRRTASAAPPAVEPDSASAAPSAQSQSFQLKGHLVPATYVELGSASGARVETLLVDEGDAVKAGDILARLSGGEALLAERDAAGLEIVRATQAIEDLHTNAGIQAARELVALRLIEDELATARSRYESLRRGPSAERIAQVHANLLLAEKGWDIALEALEKAEKRYANKNSPIWHFVSRNKFRDQITLLKIQVANAERRYWDAKDKYEDILEPPDPIDLAAAQAEVRRLEQEQIQKERDYLELAAGPDPDLIEAAQARLNAADARQAAAEEALRAVEIRSPIDGTVVRSSVQEGEWASAGSAILTVAKLDAWTIESDELGEADLPQLSPGENLKARLDAYPDLELEARLDSTSLYAREDDGEVYYTATFDLLDPPPGLRWGMTVWVEF